MVFTQTHEDFLTIFYNRCQKLGPRDLFLVAGNLLDWPQDSTMSRRQQKASPQSYLGCYTKKITRDIIREDICFAMETVL